MFNERNHNIFYTATTHEVHTFKNKNENKIIKRHFCLSSSLLYLFIRSWKIVLTETGAYDMAHDENTINSKIYIRVRPKAATRVL